MDVNLQNAILSYRQLDIFSLLKEKPKVKKKWLKKLRRKIVSYFDTEIEFTELYNILKTVEEEGYGFYIEPQKIELMTSDDEKIIFQQIELGMRYRGGKSYAFIEDEGFGVELVKGEDLKICPYINIEPSDVINVSNLQILKCIEEIDEDLYCYIFDSIVYYFCEELELLDEDCLVPLVDEVLKEYGVDEKEYCIGAFENDSVCLERNGDDWIVYTGEKAERKDIKYYDDSIHIACLDFLKRLSDSDEMYRHLKKLLLKKLRKCI